MTASTQPACVACASTDLRQHLHVAGQAGPAGLIPTTDRFGTALADIVRCADCGHGQLERFPSQRQLAEAYRDAVSEDYVEQESGQRETARALLTRLRRWAPPGPLLDLGCWTGFLLAEAREQGLTASGVEPSEFAAAYAREQLGLEVVTGDIGSVSLDSELYGAVVMADVLEHLTDPGGALDRIAAALVPGGVVCLVLPDSSSLVARVLGRRWWSVIPTHVQYFTRHSLRVLLVHHGYRVLELATAPKAFTVRYYLERVGGYSPSLARLLVGVASRLGIADRIWAPDFRDRMVVIARRPARDR